MQQTKLVFPRHLLTLRGLSRPHIEHILHRADKFLRREDKLQKSSISCQPIVACLFFEPSTRTHYSFVLAAQRLQFLVLDPVLSQSSLVKGETLFDTVRTFESMGAQCIVMRHSENGIFETLSGKLSADTHLINAGEGTEEHPTQALADLLTIYQMKKRWDLRISIVGDIRHSRVAKSLITALLTMGVVEIRLIGPHELLPEISHPSIQSHHRLEKGLQDADVVVGLRLQQERLEVHVADRAKNTLNAYCLTAKQLVHAAPDVIVMHPGPVKRGVEMADEVIDGPQSAILKQVENGVAVRMAVLDILLSS